MKEKEVFKLNVLKRKDFGKIKKNKSTKKLKKFTNIKKRKIELMIIIKEKN